MQFFDDRIVVRVDLRAAARVHQAGEAKAVELAHEMAGRVHLLFRRQLGLLADGSVKNSGIGAGDEESGGVAVSVALDFTRRWIGSVFGVAAGPQRGFVQHTAAIQVQDEDRRFGGDGVDFIKRGHTPFGELELAPTADDADPLAGRCPLRLLFEHAQSVREGRNTVPAKLEVVAKAAADDMHVGIVQSGNHPATLQINHLRVRSPLVFLRVVHSDNSPVFHNQTCRLRLGPVEGGYFGILKNQVRRGCIIHKSFLSGLMEPTFQNASDQRHHRPGEQGHDAGVAHKVRHKVVLSFQKLPHGLGGENRYGNNSQISRDGHFPLGRIRGGLIPEKCFEPMKLFVGGLAFRQRRDLFFPCEKSR